MARRVDRAASVPRVFHVRTIRCFAPCLGLPFLECFHVPRNGRPFIIDRDVDYPMRCLKKSTLHNIYYQQFRFHKQGNQTGGKDSVLTKAFHLDTTAGARRAPHRGRRARRNRPRVRRLRIERFETMNVTTDNTSSVLQSIVLLDVLIRAHGRDGAVGCGGDDLPQGL